MAWRQCLSPQVAALNVSVWSQITRKLSMKHTAWSCLQSPCLSGRYFSWDQRGFVFIYLATQKCPLLPCLQGNRKKCLQQKTLINIPENLCRFKVACSCGGTSVSLAARAQTPDIKSWEVFIYSIGQSLRFMDDLYLAHRFFRVLGQCCRRKPGYVL